MLEKFKIRNLTLQLFFSITCVVLIPVVIMALIHNEQVKTSLREKVVTDINVYNGVISQQIHNYFKSLDHNAKLAKKASKALMSSNNRQGLIDLNDFINTYGYQNLFIGDNKGNILYNIKKEADSNAQDYLPGKTQLSIAANAAIKSKGSIYTGIGQYAEYSTPDSTLFATPLMDDSQKVTGYIAIQFSFNDTIPIIVNQFKSKDNNITHYIIDSSSKIQFHSSMDISSAAYSRELPYKKWSENINRSKPEAEKLNADIANFVKSYTNSRGIRVMSTYRPVTIVGSNMLLVSEIPEKHIYKSLRETNFLIVLTIVSSILLTVLISKLLANNIKNPTKNISTWINSLSHGDKANTYIIKNTYELEELSRSVILLDQKQQTQKELLNKQQWLEQSLSGLYSEMNGVMNLEELCNKTTIYLARCINSPAAALYLLGDSEKMILKGQYGRPSDSGYLEVIEKSEGGILVEAVRNNKTIEMSDLPEGFFRIESAHLNHQPKSVYVTPFSYGNMVKGILVFASINKLDIQHKQLLKDATPPVGSAIHALELTLVGTEGQQES